jgi:hypothetical protein
LAVSQHRFPVLKLGPGEQASGELTFAPGILRPGSWLVYHNPNDAALHPARAEVR